MELGQILKSYTNSQGSKVVFRTISEADFGSIYQFALDLVAEDTFILLGGKPPTKEEELNYFKSCLKNFRSGTLFMIVIEVNGKFSGTSEIRIGVRRQSHVGDAGISLSQSVRGQGIGTEALKFQIQKAKGLGLRILTIGCFENNLRALHLYQKLGFKTAGTIPEVIYYKGNYIGEIRMFMKL